MSNNLVFENTGLDHLYINGVPIIEESVDIQEIFDKVARETSMSVIADPYFNDKTELQKRFSELHGNGNRITTDFLKDGARDILPVFGAFQRWIPEGVYATQAVNYEYNDQSGNFSWNNPDSVNVLVNSVDVLCTEGFGDITFYADGNELGTVTLPEYQIDDINYLAYNLAGNLGGSNAHYLDWSHDENIRDNNPSPTIELVVSNASSNFKYNVKVRASRCDVIGWKKALSSANNVKLKSKSDDINIACLIKGVKWTNTNKVKVRGATIKQRSGSAYVTIVSNDGIGTEKFIDSGTIGESFTSIADVSSITVELREPSDDFVFDLIINTEVKDYLPSPRYEYDSDWNPGKIIYRYQYMDTRGDDYKLDYTSRTLADVRIDRNSLDNIHRYLEEALRDYIMYKLYRAIAYKDKEYEFKKSYNMNRSYVAYWLKNDKSTQTQYHHAGV